MSKQCTEKAGVPFWVLKYAPEEKFGGATAKQTADEIINLFCDFLSENGDQEQLMGNITVKFTGHGPVRKALASLYFDQNTVYDAFSSFISQKCNEHQKLQMVIGLTSHDLFDAIHQMMQGQVSTWTEAQVEEKLSELCILLQSRNFTSDSYSDWVIVILPPLGTTVYCRCWDGQRPGRRVIRKLSFYKVSA